MQDEIKKLLKEIDLNRKNPPEIHYFELTKDFMDVAMYPFRQAQRTGNYQTIMELQQQAVPPFPCCVFIIPPELSSAPDVTTCLWLSSVTLGKFTVSEASSVIFKNGKENERQNWAVRWMLNKVLEPDPIELLRGLAPYKLTTEITHLELKNAGKPDQGTRDIANLQACMLTCICAMLNEKSLRDQIQQTKIIRKRRSHLPGKKGDVITRLHLVKLGRPDRKSDWVSTGEHFFKRWHEVMGHTRREHTRTIWVKDEAGNAVQKVIPVKGSIVKSHERGNADVGRIIKRYKVDL